MSTSEFSSLDPKGRASDLPLTEAELAVLASQLFATTFRPGPDTPR